MVTRPRDSAVAAVRNSATEAGRGGLPCGVDDEEA